MTLFANINQHSKYFRGQVAKEPFKIVLMPTSDLYCWEGNQNEYRTCDLDFFIRTESGEFIEHGLMSCIDAMAERMLLQMLPGIEEMSKHGGLLNLDQLFELRQTTTIQTMEKILKLLPTTVPRCRECGKTISDCYCES
jgi:hypothetical protein